MVERADQMNIVSYPRDAKPGDLIIGWFYFTAVLLKEIEHKDSRRTLTWLKPNGEIFSTNNLIIGNQQ